MAASEESIKKMMTVRSKLIDGLVALLDKKVVSGQSDLLRAIVDQFVDKLDKDNDGNIRRNTGNINMVGLIDKVFSQFAKKQGVAIAAGIVDGVGQIIDFNTEYFGLFTPKAELIPLKPKVVETMGAWLGVDKKGKLKENGYLTKTIGDTRLSGTVKTMMMSAVIGQKGYFDTKNSIKQLLTDSPGKAGKFTSYYRNFVYDTFSQVDRGTSKILADDLKLDYAIYEGGIVKRTRPFCRERNGKVFTREEIAAFDPEKAQPPGYDPFVDLGGYGCRHHLNWIPQALAFALRPELRKAPNPAPKQEPAAKATEPVQPKPKTTKTGKKEPIPNKVRPAKDLPFDKVQVLDLEKYNLDANYKKEAQKAAALRTKDRTLFKEQNEKALKYNELQKKLQTAVSPAEKLKLEGDMKDVYDEYLSLKAEVTSLKEQQQAINKPFLDDLLKDQPRSNIKISVPNSALKDNPALTEKVTHAIDFFRAAADGYIDDPITFKFIKGRAFADQTSSTVSLSKDDKASTFVHELAHLLEKNSTVMKNAVEFLERRTKGQPVKNMRDISKSYGPNEVYREGKPPFENPYYGKIYQNEKIGRYKNYYATEVISMGLQRMYEDPFAFYNGDPEHFALIKSLFFDK